MASEHSTTEPPMLYHLYLLHVDSRRLYGTLHIGEQGAKGRSEILPKSLHWLGTEGARAGRVAGDFTYDVGFLVAPLLINSQNYNFVAETAGVLGQSLVSAPSSTIRGHEAICFQL